MKVLFLLICYISFFGCNQIQQEVNKNEVEDTIIIDEIESLSGTDSRTNDGKVELLYKCDVFPTQTEIEEVNAYNTRPSAMAGKLPIGPICNPSIKSIKAVFNPADTDYFYFVADKNGKTYFTKTYSEHTAKVQELKNKGLWSEYK